MLRVSTVRFGHLSPSQLALWSDLQEADPSLRSPCFRPEFVRLVDAVRNDVEIAVFEQDGQSVGFLPFERRLNNRARPVAGKLSDYHGAVLRPAIDWSAEQMLQSCGLVAFDFDHLPATQSAFHRHHWLRLESPVIDLTMGFETYCEQRRAAGAAQFKRLQRRRRKLAREVGPLRFVLNERDPAAFETLLRWKRQQYQRSGLVNVLDVEWTVELLRRVLAEERPGFRGLLLALYAGDTLASLDLCIASHGVLQSWFPAYNRELASYSPGLLHLLETARHCEEHGLHCIELGRGSEDYKRFFMNDSVGIAEGSVDLRPVAGWCRRRLHGTLQRLKDSRFKEYLHRPARTLRRLQDRAALS